MTKQVTVEELRENFDQLIEALKHGESFIIMHDGEAIGSASPAQVPRGGVPFPFRDFDWGPRPKNLDTDPAELIIEERERERSGKKYGL